MINVQISNWKALAEYTDAITQLDMFQDTHDRSLLPAVEQRLLNAVQADPSYRDAQFTLGIVRELQNKHALAATDFERLLDDSPDRRTTLYNLGVTYFHQYTWASYSSAARCLKECVDLATTAGDVSLRLLAKCVLSQVFAHMTIRPVGPLPTDYETSVESNFKRAISEAAEVLQETEAVFDVSDRDEIRAGAYNGIGVALMYRGRRMRDVADLRAALDKFDHALKIQPNNARFLSNVGSAYLFIAGFDDGVRSSEALAGAEGAFVKVLDMLPDYDFAYGRLVKIAIRQKDIAKAKKYAELAEKYRNEITPEYIAELWDQIRSADKNILT